MQWRWWWQSLNNGEKLATVCWGLAFLWTLAEATTHLAP